jgi:hydroxyethylthiazole kinase
MTIARDEIASFVTGANALLVNLGTFDGQRGAAIDAAIGAANVARKPWLLDPVFIDRSPPSARFARELLTRGLAVMRLNQAEFGALSDDPTGARGPGSFAGAIIDALYRLDGATLRQRARVS